MPLLNVTSLVQHANRYGYMVPAFSARGADEIQAVVTAAEANRAPAIIAVETSDHSFAAHELSFTVAEAFATRATVPIGIEVVTRTELEQRRVTWWLTRNNDLVQTSDAMAAINCGFFDRPVARGDSGATCDVEIWPAPAVACDSVRADRIGVAVDEQEGKVQHISTLRKRIERLRSHFAGPLVVNGDINWRDGILPALPHLGVAKINFDHRLRRAMASANRHAAQTLGDDFRRAMDHVAAALVAEVTECLRRTGSTGRAADVTAYALVANRQNHQVNSDAAIYRNTPISAPLASTRVATRHEPRSLKQHAAHNLHVSLA